MATVSFRLKRPKEPETTVFAIIYWPGAKVKVYTDVRVQSAHWNKPDQRVFKSHLGSKLLNTQLDLIEERLLACYTEHRAAGTLPTKEQLAAAIAPEEPTAPEPTPAHPTVEAAYAHWQGHKATLSINTYRSRQTTLRHLQGFVKAKRGRTLDWLMFTDEFLSDYARYLAEHRGLFDSAIWKSVYAVKTFLTWADAQGMPTGNAYKRYRYTKHDPEIVTLTEEEVARIEGLDLMGEETLANARSLFLIQVYTSLRFSDVQALRPEQIGKDSIVVRVKKTKETLTIPIHPKLRPLLAAVQAGTIWPLENQVLNRHLKELGQRADLTEPVLVVRYRLERRIEMTVPKWQLLTTHTGRRSAITQMLAWEIRRDIVKRISGHRDEKSFQRYVNVTPRDVLQEFAKKVR